MRIDKYLWCVRYYKTRNIATEACKKGHIRINGETVKPSREVYKNDSITVRKNQINYQLEVLNIPESRVGAKLVNLLRLLSKPNYSNWLRTTIARKEKAALPKKIGVLLTTY